VYGVFSRAIRDARERARNDKKARESRDSLIAKDFLGRESLDRADARRSTTRRSRSSDDRRRAKNARARDRGARRDRRKRAARATRGVGRRRRGGRGRTRARARRREGGFDAREFARVEVETRETRTRDEAARIARRFGRRHIHPSRTRPGIARGGDDGRGVARANDADAGGDDERDE